MIKLELRRALLFAAVVLPACAGVSADWVKEGATKEEIRADNAACRAEVEAVVGREADITHDIRVGRAGTASEVNELVEQTRDVGAARRYDRLFGACMRARGYSRRQS